MESRLPHKIRTFIRQKSKHQNVLRGSKRAPKEHASSDGTGASKLQTLQNPKQGKVRPCHTHGVHSKFGCQPIHTEKVSVNVCKSNETIPKQENATFDEYRRKNPPRRPITEKN